MASWNAADKNASLALSNGNLTATVTGSNTSSTNSYTVRATAADASNSLYWEVSLDATFTGGGGGPGVGLAIAAETLNNALGTTTTHRSIGYRLSNGKVDYNNTLLATIVTAKWGDVIGIAWRKDLKLIWFRQMQRWPVIIVGGWNNDVLANQDPASGIGGYDITTLQGLGTGLAAFDAGTTNAAATGNFGGGSGFLAAAPSGFLAYDGSSPTVMIPGPPTARLMGVNLAGLEFGSTVLPGTLGVDYFAPTAAELDYYKNKGLTLIRLPFRWERIQPSLNAALNAGYLATITTIVNAAATRHMKVVLDVHNYGKYGPDLIGSVAVPNTAFADLWTRIATAFVGNSGVFGYGLCNEPNLTSISLTAWASAAQAAVTAIRAVDTATAIIIAGDGGSPATSWIKIQSNNWKIHTAVIDPNANLIFEAHQYADKPLLAGVYPGSYASTGDTATTYADLIQPFLVWLGQNSLTGYLGEYGVPNNDTNWLTLINNLYIALQESGVYGTYWAGGPAWGAYNLSCEPSGVADAAQMSIIQTYPSPGVVLARLTLSLTNNRGLTNPPSTIFNAIAP